jgi:polyhydroxybutyrate depolymerase
MNVFAVSFLLLVCVAHGCKDDRMRPETGLLRNQVITVGGVQRNYHLYVPDNHRNAPVVFLFHGNGGSSDDLLGLSGVKAPYKVWMEIARNEQLVLVVPNGTLGSQNSRGWNDCRTDAPRTPQVDDVQLIVDLLDFLAERYAVNEARVFAVGTSNGGHFAIRLAKEIPGRITAFAAVLAANAVNSACAEEPTPVSALFMNGTSDTIMPYEGGNSGNGEVFSTDISVAYWVHRNGTYATPVVTEIPDINASDGSTVTRFLYPGGTGGAEVALVKVQQGGHTEPSIAERYSAVWLSIVGPQNGDLEMANEIWNFFRTKSR